MPTLSITKTYANGNVLTESDLDNIKDDVETFLNTTQIDDDNIQTGGVGTDSIANNAITAAKIATAVAGAGLAGGGGSALSVNVDGSTITIPADTLGVPANGITATEIIDDIALAGNCSTVGTFTSGGNLTVGTGGPTLANNSGVLNVTGNIKPNSSSGDLAELEAAPNARTLGVREPGGSLYSLLVGYQQASHGLKVIAGHITTGGTGTGSGFSVSGPVSSVYTITFDDAFHATPYVVATVANSNPSTASVSTRSTSNCTIDTFNSSGSASDEPISFIAIGERGV